MGEIVALCLAYAVAAAAVFVWKFFTAERLVNEERAKLAVLDTLDPTEKRQLQLLVLKGREPVGQIVFNTIENKTRLIQRGFIGWWRVEQEYKDLLMRWAKTYKSE